ncbi:hypothetical protein [Halorubrum luteum]
MNSLVFPVAVVGSVATLVMVIATLYLVWLAIGDDAHTPRLDDGTDRPELGSDEEDTA